MTDAGTREPAPDDETLPPLPLDRGPPLTPTRIAVIVAVLLVSVLVRLAIRSADSDREARRASDTLVIPDPGAGLPPAERAALDEAIRRGDPLVLGADGRLRPATAADADAHP